MRKIYLLVLLFISIFSNAQKLEGQAKIDSLLVELPKMKEDSLKVNLLNQLGAKYVFDDQKSCIKYSNLAINLSKKINFNKGISYGYMHIGNSYIIKENFKQANLEYKKGLQYAKTPNVKAMLYLGFVSGYFYQSNYPKSIEIGFLALKQFELVNDKKNIVKTLRNIGMNYLQYEQYEKAIAIYEKCSKLNKEVKLDIDCSIMHEVGICYFNLNKNELAKSNFNKAKALCKDDNELVAVCYASLGDVALKENQFSNAVIYYKKALPTFKEIEDINNYTQTLSNFGKCNLEMSKVEKNISIKYILLKTAISSSEESLSKGKDILGLLTISEANNTLSQSYKLQGNYKESLAAHEQYVIYKDSVFNADNKETIKNLEDKREIELRDNQIKINKLSLEAKEKQKWYLFGGLGLLTVIGGLLFYQSRKRKQINLKLETLNKDLDQANKAKTRFFGILNHDLRGPVANLVFFLQLQQESPEMLDSESIKRMQDKTMTGAENLLSTMEDILQWSKSQMENFKPQPKNFPVKQLFDDTKKVFSGYLKISFEYQNPENLDVFTDENYLKTIIRNLTSNAINAFTTTENPKIIWKAWQEDNKIYFSIQDNGPGASQEQLKALFEDTEISSAKSGLGLYLIRDMAKAINCEISVDSKIEFGTTFTLKL